MEKTIYSIHQNNDKTTTYIRASVKTPDDLGFIAVKTGFVEVQAEKAPALLKALNENELAFEFGAQNAQGNYELTPVRVTANALVETEA